MKEKVTAIVLAAGKGTRMNAKIQKQYMNLLGQPVITYALNAFERSSVDEIILVVAPEETEYARKNIVEKYGYSRVSAIVTGGKERYDSVYRALCSIEKKTESDYVLIHDGARAFITPELIDFCISSVKKEKSCVMGMPVKDTIKIVDTDHFAIETPQRSTMWQVQTPQCFLTEEIRDAYRKMMETGDTSSVTDDGMVMETYGKRRVKMIEGSYKNIKITTPEDMIFGEAIIKEMRDRGDVHENRKCSR
ncbi:MAG: 2-C-methyl-D-erythritol 4-phosphate cytidylyltransferase [Eubacterium sp.]|nr:2-C-methyl-D-erythritol 4-phosphate cytidylyltransferase [Eubacterium sp.]MDD7208622.1 2-C-methyl-D-erythritol 4-phosphate cytidylyltransferase [Lachnospiraceae bacterium]MDY5497403.1 2-C-methyl-D-erythritol 4-phosphate cytidylyltransferase [Anaerobutyricum sp.]